MNYYTREDLTKWMKENRWTNTSLSKKLAEMGSPISHQSIHNWRHGLTAYKRKELMDNFSSIVGFRAERFILTEKDEAKLKELSAIMGKDEALKTVFSYID